MRTPKPPAGFIPVDSEEAKGIDRDALVNVARIINGVWLVDSIRMGTATAWAVSDQAVHYHVQLPPKVEWEEVWGWTFDGAATWLHERIPEGRHDMRMPHLGKKKMDTIVAALNEMEVGNAD